MKKAFTLIELLVVMAVIGILATITAVSIGKARERQKIAQAKADVGKIALSVSMLYADTRMYPGKKTDLEIWPAPWINEINEVNGTFKISSGSAGLVNNSVGFPNWSGPYYKGALNDPWGASYYFSYRMVPEIKSVGEKLRVTVAVISYGANTDPGNNNLLDVYGCNDIYKVLSSGDPSDYYFPNPYPYTGGICTNFNGEVN